MPKGKILFQLSGSIACFKACQVISRLVQADFKVEVVATKAALNFVGEATLEGLTGNRVHTETFAPGEYMSHIHLMRWADLIVLCPATANTLNRLASGSADDLIGALFLAHDFNKPYLVAPAMNQYMLRHPATQDSLKKLADWGLEILDAGAGHLACGEVGDGRLIEPESLLSIILSKFASQPPERKLSVLITSGGTREPIDGVRMLTNSSTGRTGATIADYFTSRGHSVTFVHAEHSALPEQAPERSLAFTTVDDLDRILRAELSRAPFSSVIHAAAVGDYKVERLEAGGEVFAPLQAGKLETRAELVIRLKATPKLVDHLREYAKDPNLCVVAFKLTNSTDVGLQETAVAKLAQHARPDFIVHNDLGGIGADQHTSTIYGAAGDKVASSRTKTELAQTLEKLLLERKSKS